MTYLSGMRAVALSMALVTVPVISAFAEAPRAVETRFAEAMKRPAASAARATFDPAAFNALLEGEAELRVGSAEFDRRLGAQRLKQVSFHTLGNDPSTVFTADEILLWNLDTSTLMDRIGGERLGETLRVFDRIEFSGLKFDTTEYTNTVNEVLDPSNFSDLGKPAPRTEEGSVAIERAILSGLTLHPWTYQEKAGDEEEKEDLRLLSAMLRSLSLEDVVLTNFSSHQVVSDTDLSGTISATYPRQIIYGYDRGNIGGLAQMDARFSMTFNMLDERDARSKPSTLKIDGVTGYSAWTGLSFAKLLEWGERGEAPPVTEQDLWTLGTYTLQDMTANMNGAQMFSVRKMEAAADKFSWFFPERLTFKHEGLSLDLENMFSALSVIEETFPTEGTDVPSMKEMAGILKRAGLGKITSDGTATLTWDKTTGRTLLEGRNASNVLFHEDMRFEARLPSYAQLVPHFGVDGRTPDEDGLETLLQDQFAFRKGHWSLKDAGGLDAIARLVIEIAKVVQKDGEQPTMMNFAEATPETVRMFASGAVMMGSGEVTKMVPQAMPWLVSLSQFLTQGGELKVDLSPASEVTLQSITDLYLQETATDDAGALATHLGVSVTHTPPAPK